MAQPFDLTPVLASVEPAEAVEYFRQKGYRIGFDYRDVWQQEHQAAFTVAKAMQIDLLKEIRGQVDKALAEGTTFADFKRALKPALVDRGWWGKQEVVDPQTGEAQVAQLGSARRLGVIFDTNLATAYSEGQWERIQRNKGLFPFLEYVRSASAHPRVSHLAYAGTVLPADHPFWRAHMPVKEWGCKCTVIQHSQRSLEREGLAVTDAPPEEMRSLVNKRTGETMEIPVGVDPAFHYPLGGRRANLGKMMMDKADAASASTAARVLADGAAQWAPLVQTEFAEFVGRYAEGERREIGTRRVVGVFSPQVLQRLASAGLQPQKATIAVDMRRLQHLLGSNRDAARQAKGTGAEFLATVPASLMQLGEAWLDVDKKRLYLFGTSAEPGKAVRTVVELDVPMRRDELSNTVVSTMLMDPADQDKTGLVQIQ